MTPFQKKIYDAVHGIPAGKVSTYAHIAAVAGNPHAMRAVGNALNKNPFASIPCHRVVRSDARVGGFARGTRAKTRLLKKEGVIIKNGVIDPSCFY